MLELEGPEIEEVKLSEQMQEKQKMVVEEVEQDVGVWIPEVEEEEVYEKPEDQQKTDMNHCDSDSEPMLFNQGVLIEDERGLTTPGAAVRSPGAGRSSRNRRGGRGSRQRHPPTSCWNFLQSL